MKRGTVCWVNLEPAHPPEFGKVRPAVVVSNSEQNQNLPTIVVVPLSLQPPEIWPLRLKFPMQKGKISFAITPGIRQISKTRITEVGGRAGAAVMAAIDDALSAYLRD